MFGSLIGNKSYGQEYDNENSLGDAHDNMSLASPLGRSSYFVRRESKINLETKIQRASSLIEDANIEEIKTRFRSKSEYMHLSWIIFPDDTFKIFWDILIVRYELCSIMIYTITVIPYRIAFSAQDSESWMISDLIIDSIFIIDVLVNCFCAYYVNDDEIETSNKKIFLNYLKSWMIVDILASIPFELIFNSYNWKSFVKIGRFLRLYRLVKMPKILRIIRSQQGFQTFTETVGLNFRIPLGIKRLASFLMVFFLVCHLFACFWYFISTVQSDSNLNWVSKYGIQDSSESDLYIASFYWTVTTFTTVGYGDITPSSSLERGICIFVMLGGVFFYSYTVGIIASLMSDMDKKKAKFDSKMLILQDIDKNYAIGKRLLKKIKAALEYDQNRFNKDRDEMIASLPKKLALVLNLIMNKKLVEKNKFFENRPIPFINMILTCLRPIRINAKDHVFYRSEYAIEMYFVTLGELACYDTYNTVDISFDIIGEGNYCGDIGVMLSEPHEYSVKTVRDSELLALTRNDLFSKVINYFDDQLKTSLILKTNERKEMLQHKREAAVSEYIRNKNLVKSIANETKRQESLDTPIIHFTSEKNARRINKIRNTLSPKTLSMLEFTAPNEIDRVKKEIEILKSSVNRFQEKIKHLRTQQDDKEKFNKTTMSDDSSLEIGNFIKIAPIPGQDQTKVSSALKNRTDEDSSNILNKIENTNQDIVTHFKPEYHVIPFLQSANETKEIEEALNDISEGFQIEESYKSDT